MHIAKEIIPSCLQGPSNQTSCSKSEGVRFPLLGVKDPAQKRRAR